MAGPITVLTAVDVDAIVGAVDVASPLGVRDRAALEVLWATGVRRLELEALLVDDVDLAEDLLTVRRTSVGRGRRRLVPFDGRCASWLGQWLFEARPALVPDGFDDGALFVDHDGQGIDVGWLDYRVVGYATAAGLEVPDSGRIGYAGRGRILDACDDPDEGFRRLWGEDC